ncbi:c-type cytochrome [Azohydromonas aeria]|uniref:c-type cytochrome n=1 Tax=Azohydromonas aeria TaxID=2590212 RepID=UPI0012FAB14D|nr:c-type cytochrome [Azohydromonas aeria]
MNRITLSLALVSLGLMAACGKQEPAAAPQATPAAATATTPVAAPENALGKKVYGSTCAMCHSAGVAGAPKPGDKADWGTRTAQGMETVYKHAIEGFNGAKGQMPAKGGNAALKDDEVKAAVDYMVAQSR